MERGSVGALDREVQTFRIVVVIFVVILVDDNEKDHDKDYDKYKNRYFLIFTGTSFFWGLPGVLRPSVTYFSSSLVSRSTSRGCLS